MATTKSNSKPSTNGSAPAALKDVGDSAVSTARRAKTPLIAAGAAAAGLVGGLAAGALRDAKRRDLLGRRPRVLGMPIGPKSGAARTFELLMDGAKHLNSAAGQVSGTTNDVRELNEQLDRLNRRSPLEVVLDGLTHRRGAHKREG
jgi:hypothetical protein